MSPKLTLIIATVIALIFSLGMFLRLNLLREQFPNSDGQGFNDLVTLDTSWQV